MSPPLDIPWYMLTGLDEAREDVFTMKASVCTGFEQQARDEISVKLRSVAYIARGRVFFDVRSGDIDKVFRLRSVDHIDVVVAVRENFGFDADQDVCRVKLEALPTQLRWIKCLMLAHRVLKFRNSPLTGPAQLPAPLCDTQVTRISDGVAGVSTVELNGALCQHSSGESGNVSTVKMTGGEPGAADEAANILHQTESCSDDETQEVSMTVMPDGGTCSSQSLQIEVNDTAAGSAADIPTVVRVTPTTDSPADQETPRSGDSEKTVVKVPLLNYTSPEGKCTAECSDCRQMSNPYVGMPSFRVTCLRSGDRKRHAFDSQTAAKWFGGAVQDFFGWEVQMKNSDLEVVLTIDDDYVTVAIVLTRRGLFLRNMAKLGPTSLRATICFNMLMLARPKSWEVVVDPLCGGGSISLEGVQAFPGTYHLCGDHHHESGPRVLINRDFCQQQLRQDSEQSLVDSCSQLAVDVMRWDATKLPLRDSVADIIVSDLPFGKRLGSVATNTRLYPLWMQEMARICCPRYGRAVLLTHDKRSMQRALNDSRVRRFWTVRSAPRINVGGLAAIAYLLARSDVILRDKLSNTPGALQPAENAGTSGTARVEAPSDTDHVQSAQCDTDNQVSTDQQHCGGVTTVTISGASATNVTNVNVKCDDSGSVDPLSTICSRMLDSCRLADNNNDNNDNIDNSTHDTL